MIPDHSLQCSCCTIIKSFGSLHCPPLTSCNIMLLAIKYNENEGLQILDQLQLPLQSIYISIANVEDAFQAIKTMQVRGAPAIAIVGILGLAVELKNCKLEKCEEIMSLVCEKLGYLITSRPTAVNLSNAASELKEFAQKILKEDLAVSSSAFINRLRKFARDMLDKDLSDNHAMGHYGCDAIVTSVDINSKVSLLTHCNTGSLATAGYGTALGVIRSVFTAGRLERAYCTETRPYNQGARLTAYELVHDKIPATLICDSMVAILMQRRTIAAVVVGADRVARNGDTANKIGTFQLAIVARNFAVPFYVCAPLTSVDFNMASGDEIPIEERPDKELVEFKGTRVAAPGVECWNPAFDVTPADFITGIITEKGVVTPSQLQSLAHS